MDKPPRDLDEWFARSIAASIAASPKMVVLHLDGNSVHFLPQADGSVLIERRVAPPGVRPSRRAPWVKQVVSRQAAVAEYRKLVGKGWERF